MQSPPPLPGTQLPPPLPKAKEKKGFYDLDSLEGIEAIKIPLYNPISGVQSPTDNIEYILQRKATEHKKNGRMDLAIACLRKSNEIFPYSNFLWSINDYIRLVEFLKQAGKFDDARIEENQIDELFQSNSMTISVHKKILLDCNTLGTDLVTSTDDNFTVCGECAKYTKRIFCISGKNDKFPVLPAYFNLNLHEHKYCYIGFYPFLLGLSISSWIYTGDLMSWSNRPFVDERTLEQKMYFEKRVKDGEQEIIDRKNYDLLREKLYEIAPKSFGGFRNMKNRSSANYLSAGFYVARSVKERHFYKSPTFSEKICR